MDPVVNHVEAPDSAGFSPDKTAVLHNPVSGRAVSRRRACKMLTDLATAGYEIHQTQEPGQATSLARQCVADGAEALVIVGGDGTILEAIQDLSPSVRLAPFPTGTVNLFVRGLGLPFRKGCLNLRLMLV